MTATFHAKTSITILLCALCALTLASSVFAGSPAKGKDASAVAAVTHIPDADSMRVAGEQRFRANCGRCHNAPQKFPPRMMGTILRHMRVRATITDEDRRLILFYMTQ
ncbi:MAG TPA: cytochrome c [Candidatus Binatus sp.]|nr:cytochrome c [Candidatus Binatus sp.]